LLIYLFFLQRTAQDDVVIETFADLNGYPASLSPSTFVIVRRNKKKRNKPYDYPQVLHPNHYFRNTASNERIPNGVTRTDYVSNTNHKPLSPYTTVTTTHETTTTLPPPLPPPPPPPPQQPVTPHRSFEYNPSNLLTSPSMTTIAPQPPIPFQTQAFRTPVPSYPYQSRPSPTHWHQMGTNTMNRSLGYASEPAHDYIQRDYFPPNRSHVIERSFERKPEPRLLHYYTGYDYFATVDPSDAILTRHNSPMTGPGTAIRYGANPPYHSNDYIKSTM
jgi:hypothetical protein